MPFIAVLIKPLLSICKSSYLLMLQVAIYHSSGRASISILISPFPNMFFKLLTLITFGRLIVGAPLADNPDVKALAKRAVSPDASCGGSLKYTCKGSQWGNCCSQFGFW